MHTRKKIASALVLFIPCLQVSAYELVNHEKTKLNANFQAIAAFMHSDESYSTVGQTSSGSKEWQEGYVKLGFDGSQAFALDTTLYGALSALSSGTWGDGDAAGFTKGTERRTAIEDAYLGWRSGNLFPAFGNNGIDISSGRQEVTVGDGFLIKGDALNFGDANLGSNFDRGGAYYLAPRKAFDKTTVLRIGGSSGLRGDFMWLKSDNRAQAQTELAVVNAEYISDSGTLGTTYIKGLDVNPDYSTPAQLERDGMETVSMRGKSSFGIDDLNLAFEYATQDKKSGRENAWYLEGSWTFSETPWKPAATYRYSRFSEEFDPLFYGLSRGYGTWFQGEVAGNYAGPFNTNTRVHHVGFKARPSDDLTIGALYFDFDGIDKSHTNLSGHEADIYVEWMINEHFMISPLIGFFKPDKSSENGGLQTGSNNLNSYFQLVVGTFF